VGTIKSRVGRARAALTAMLESGNIPDTGDQGGADAHSAIMAELEGLTGPAR
jgi:RNA polymerase sigma-70 factor (ECF subfamily)